LLAIMTKTLSDPLRIIQKVAVIGAGAGGLVTANVLREDGFDVSSQKFMSCFFFTLLSSFNFRNLNECSHLYIFISMYLNIYVRLCVYIFVYICVYICIYI
jgi:hypothetical protein